MGPGMPRLLLNERLDGRLQLRVVDERRGLKDGFDEVTLTFRQQQVQNIDHVRNERVAGHPVHRQVRPVETNLAPKCRMSVVLPFHLGHSAHLSCALRVVGAWLWGRPPRSSGSPCRYDAPMQDL